MNSTTDYQTIADDLCGEMQRHDGLAPVDVERFWADNKRAQSDPFADDCPQMPMGLGGNMGECVFAELGIKEDWYRWNHDPAWRVELNKAYNDLSEKIVGRRLLDESLPDPQRRWPKTQSLADIFEARNVWHNESFWLQQSADTVDELKALLDRVEARLENLRAFMIPPDWDEHKSRLDQLGVRPPRYRAQRGPCTFATSVFGPENMMFLVMDEPELAMRFRDLILRSMLGLADVLDAEAARNRPDDKPPHGFAFLDDNCCLFTPEMYELFGLPVLRAIFDRFSPDPKDSRYQHSDSAMAHLLPLLGTLNMTAVNFGPTVMIDHIRTHMPRTRIDGVLAPFTFCRNEFPDIVTQCLRDIDLAREHGKGVNFTTAGSVNNGSSLKGLRLVMATIQRYGRFD